MKQQHILQQTLDGYQCECCFVTWKQPPEGRCPGVRIYQYTMIPWDEMATFTQLKRQKLKPADETRPSGCYFRLRDKSYIYLYKIAEAQPRRVPTEAQREAIERMRVALKKKYTCQRCGWYDDSHGQTRYNRMSTLTVSGQEQRLCEDCRDYLIWVYDRHVIEHNMRVWLEAESASPFLVIDTETTGLPDSEGFQVVEVAAVDKAGAVIFHSLIKPDIPMPEAAKRIHGLTNDDLTNAPCLAEIWPRLIEALAGYDLWAYNAGFDQAALLESAERFKLDIPKQLADRDHWHCLMHKFARYYGEYSTGLGRERWKDLATACDELEVQRSGYHRATGDAINALGVMQALAARDGTYPAPEERPIGYYNYY